MSVLTLVIVLCFFLFQGIQTKGLSIISNSKAKTVGDILYVNWSVTTHDGNASGLLYFQVYFCPLDVFQDRTNCQNVNHHALCNATNISTRQHKLLDRTSRRWSLFTQNSSATITSTWNERRARFTCTVHSIDECWTAYQYPQIKGQVLITTSNANGKEKVILDVERNQEPSKYLNQPNHITLVQRSRNTVTVGWKACHYDNPEDVNIDFHEDGGKILKCRLTLNEGDFYSRRNWEYNCNFAHLRPYTNYTVKVYSCAGLSCKSSLPGIKTFRTDEQAPSHPPTFVCVLCSQHILKNGNRIVNVRWKLPPKDKLNGLVRQTKLKYWVKDDSNTTKIVIYRNLTTEGSVELKVDMEYFVQMKICTLEHLCSDYREPKLISKIRRNPGSKASGFPKMMVIALVVICIVVVFAFSSCALLCWRKQHHRERKQKNNPLEDLKLPDNSEGSTSENSDWKINLGCPRKDSLQSSEYSELPLDVSETEKHDYEVLPTA